ncbi:gluconokinase [Aquipuribacter sp. SD81]|uniref:gluconokinase n=1 Tax=Aquipuribacter sp. SD81 TaxID=3127703 RepID=UPI003018F118
MTVADHDGDLHHLVVMGVSGTGKSTIAAELERLLGWTFLEGDSLHPRRNVEKMSAGTPLTDQDRAPWLQAIADWTAVEHVEGRSSVVTCSALRRVYRNVLREDVPGTWFVHLVGDPDLIMERMETRKHFMPPSMLRSQLDTLEPLGDGEDGATFDISDTPEAIAAQVLDRLGLEPRPEGERDADAQDDVEAAEEAEDAEQEGRPAPDRSADADGRSA